MDSMEMLWRSIVSTLMLCFLFGYFYYPPILPNPSLILFFFGLIFFLFIIDRNRSTYDRTEVLFEETRDAFCVLHTFDEDSSVLDVGGVIDKNKECCNLTRYYDDVDDNECFSHYGAYEVDNDGYKRGDYDDNSKSNEYDVDDGDANGDGNGYEDDDTLKSRIEDYIASVYNGWREERQAEKLHNRFFV